MCENLSIKNDDLTFNVGGKGVWCNSHKKMEEIQAQFMAGGFKWGEAWARAAILNSSKKEYNGQFVSAGACFCENKDRVVTTELSWDLTNKFKGFQGMPLLWNLSTLFRFSNGATMNYKFFFAQKWMVVSKWETPVVDGVKLIHHANADIKCAFSCPKDFALKSGLAIELKL